jgi:hypothetical protein
MFFIHKCIKIIFFYFLKIIFNISTSKRSKNTKKLLILNKKKFKIFPNSLLYLSRHLDTQLSKNNILSHFIIFFFYTLHSFHTSISHIGGYFCRRTQTTRQVTSIFFFSQNQLNSRKKAHNHLNFFFGFHH